MVGIHPMDWNSKRLLLRLVFRPSESGDVTPPGISCSSHRPDPVSSSYCTMVRSIVVDVVGSGSRIRAKRVFLVHPSLWGQVWMHLLRSIREQAVEHAWHQLIHIQNYDFLIRF